MSNSSIYSENELLSRLADGDETAFEQLFHTYHNRLGNYVQRFTNSFLLTQEIVQDVFLKIWLNRAILRDVEHFGPYLFVVARNYAFNSLKQLAREYDRKEQWQEGFRGEFGISEERTTYTEMLKAVNRAVGELPPQQKKVFLLSREKGLTQEEIARDLNISLNTVKKHMVLALKFLREELGSNINVLLLIFFTGLGI